MRQTRRPSNDICGPVTEMLKQGPIACDELARRHYGLTADSSYVRIETAVSSVRRAISKLRKQGVDVQRADGKYWIGGKE